MEERFAAIFEIKKEYHSGHSYAEEQEVFLTFYQQTTSPKRKLGNQVWVDLM